MRGRADLAAAAVLVVTVVGLRNLSDMKSSSESDIVKEKETVMVMKMMMLKLKLIELDFTFGCRSPVE